ncbi:hypothetical protein OIU77_024489 [Salix suchowensis]|uniref:Uncharacterized protein n=1 Tax=Salix suchowensis TaxID=1278906 RepID=A0ABQ9BSY4_9ROSI|nr:hypothetical protein OIU77_024489 [Salix suchowensis]
MAGCESVNVKNGAGILPIVSSNCLDLGHKSDHPKPANPTTPEKLEIASSALKIIHGGGRVECYYMAIPAARILEKYPSHALAKPEVFRSPWNSVVRPEKIPTPGQDSLPVPHHTVKRLRRKIREPGEESSSSSVSSTSKASNDTSTDMVSDQLFFFFSIFEKNAFELFN